MDAQRLLTLDSCRVMALRNNKQLGVSMLKQEMAANVRKSARTKYLPHFSAIGTYQFTSEPISLLSNDQKTALNNLGTVAAGNLQQGFTTTMSQLPPQFLQSLGAMGLSPEGIQQLAGQGFTDLGKTLNAIGQEIVEAFDTDTRNMFAGSVMLSQPIFMGGSIIAMNKMADLGEEMASNTTEVRRQSTLYNIDKRTV